MRKKLCFLILLIALLTNRLAILALGDEIVYTENHFVILYDTSSSMVKVDVDHIISDRIASFLNTIPEEQYPIKVSVIPFDTTSETALPGSRDGYWYVTDKNDSGMLKQIRDFVANLDYDGEDTDIGGALEYCQNLLEQMRGGAGRCRQTVLFMTDGYIDYLERGDIQNKFTKVMQSYEKVKVAAEEFPEDCFFLGIIPQEDAFTDKVIYDESREGIIYYFDADVPEEYQRELPAVVDAMKYFCNRLVERQPEDQVYHSRIKSIDWSGNDTENSFQNVYTEFFDTIFQTKTITVPLLNSQEGYPFYVPDAISEVSITATPDAEGIAEKREIVSEFLTSDAIVISNEDGRANYITRDSRSDITFSLLDPESGDYMIKNMSDRPVAVTLQFTSYGDLRLRCEKQDYGAALGQTVHLEGEVVSAGGTEVSEYEMESVALWYREVNQDEMNEIGSQGTKFSTDYVAKTTGTHYISLGLEYNDMDRNGVTAFSREDLVIVIDVPSVEYRFTCEAEEIKVNQSAPFRVTPYSVVNGSEVGVAAVDCEQYLGDSWKVELTDGKSSVLQISEDGKSFEGQLFFEKAGEYEVRFVNQEETEIYSLKLQIQDEEVETEENTKAAVPQQESALDKIKPTLPYLFAAAILALILIIVLSRRNREKGCRINIHYSGKVKSFSFIMRENNSKSITIQGKRLTFSYWSGQIHYFVDGQEYRMTGHDVYI